ncbi:MAG: helix-turn-helix transcriptional regulator [Pseudomonadales bacterium]
MATTLGEKIKKLRKKEGYTLDKLAELAGCSKSYIWELENNSPPRPSAEKLSRIAEELKVTLDYFLGEEISEADAVDEKFYRRYRNLSEETKEKIRKIVDVWEDE